MAAPATMTKLIAHASERHGATYRLCRDSAWTCTGSMRAMEPAESAGNARKTTSPERAWWGGRKRAQRNARSWRVARPARDDNDEALAGLRDSCHLRTDNVLNAHETLPGVCRVHELVFVHWSGCGGGSNCVQHCPCLIPPAPAPAPSCWTLCMDLRHHPMLRDGKPALPTQRCQYAA